MESWLDSGGTPSTQDIRKGSPARDSWSGHPSSQQCPLLAAWPGHL